ncbi:hypothetical protein EMWEY_00002770 [Eimeria maxima]|uniref:Uncharacterized protein n=1 Tax=Eimeria maxima TaxID=5804 RepID=U6MAF6_EIMMA|nr:hypothetical protein EMWEY_00002770 [Eimeria maxima]CDJ58630.1 hypothetical protein EMWEY_00002770 [Eimeria maxima]
MKNLAAHFAHFKAFRGIILRLALALMVLQIFNQLRRKGEVNGGFHFCHWLFGCEFAECDVKPDPVKIPEGEDIDCDTYMVEYEDDFINSAEKAIYLLECVF